MFYFNRRVIPPRDNLKSLSEQPDIYDSKDAYCTTQNNNFDSLLSLRQLYPDAYTYYKILLDNHL